MTNNEWQEKITDYVDERKANIVGNAQRLPRGEHGVCLLFIKDSMLNVYDTDFHLNIGEIIYTVNLHLISGLKTSACVFNPMVKFVYNGEKYYFLISGDRRAFIKVITEEAAKMG